VGGLLDLERIEGLTDEASEKVLLERLKEHFRKDCKVAGFSYYPAKTEKDKQQGHKWCFSSIPGGKMRNLFANISVTKLFPNNFELAQRSQAMWKDFWSLFVEVNTSDKEEVKAALDNRWETRMDQWLFQTFQCPTADLDDTDEDYVGPLLPSSGLTPYIHIFSAHLGELLRTHGEIHSFSCQALELMNLKHGVSFMKKTSRRTTADWEILLQNYRSFLNSAKIDRETCFCKCGAGFVKEGNLHNHRVDCSAVKRQVLLNN
jgi:hypothetical protein